MSEESKEEFVMAETVNKKYKDRLFRKIFGETGSRENMLSLYNALNHTAYTNTDDLMVTTIEDVIYMGMKNDVSILLDSYMSLWEQQSTYNPNMPLRGLLYFGKLYDSYVSTKRYNIYGKRQIPLPTPQYVVLYNGADEREAVEYLKLSDAFIHPDKSGDFEWTAKMVNINKGKNEELLSRCKPLSDYMYLVEKIRAYQKTESTMLAAVDKAVNECINEGILSEWLTKHKAEVLDMCITEYNEKLHMDDIREEGREEGRQEGREEGRQEERVQIVFNMYSTGMSPEEIAKLTMIPLHKVLEILKEK